jgi:hypothetical protein
VFDRKNLGATGSWCSVSPAKYRETGMVAALAMHGTVIDQQGEALADETETL